MITNQQIVKNNLSLQLQGEGIRNHGQDFWVLSSVVHNILAVKNSASHTQNILEQQLYTF